MHIPGNPSRSTARRQIQIGRILLEVALLERQPVPRCERGAGQPDAAYMLVVPMNERLTYSQSGRSGSIDAGEYVLLSQMEAYEINAPADTPVLTVRIPAVELRARLASVDDHIGRRFGANEQMTRLLASLLYGVSEVFSERAPPNPEALATEIISFITLAISSEDRGSTLDVRNGRYRLRRRIFDFIESNLGDQALSPKKIAANSRISLSYLYSLFNDDDTTVSQFLQVKRLQRAYELLVADPKGHLTIAEIAYQVGFKNVSHFSRTFSRHFSMAPRDARQVNRSPALSAVVSDATGVHAGGPLQTARMSPERLQEAV